MKALITGITGQDGSYLAELLLSKAYEVHGLVRRTSQDNHNNIKDIEDDIVFHYGDMTDSESINNAIKKIMPDEVYNLAAMSQVRISYEVPTSVNDINYLGFIRLAEAVKRFCPDSKIYQAGSSEMFGEVIETPQTEETPFNPQSPYGVSKVAAFRMARVYRKAYKLNIYNGILFNHESFRRGDTFLSKKVVKAAVRIKLNKQKKLTLGNLDSSRDWGYAKEYVEWIWRIMQGEPDDFIICTGETHTVREFVEETFSQLGMDDFERYVNYDKSLERPAEVNLLLGDSSKSKKLLGFTPKVKFKKLINIMIIDETRNT